jgi:DNA polymerase IV (archaeal DinB-like DNA polymerase)
MKINTIGQLAKIDVQILIQRFGKKIGTWMWQVSNGIENEPVIPRGDHISLSSESTLESFTRDRQEIEKLLNELVDELYGRITNNGYQFRTVGIKLVRTDFSIETREISYPNYQNDRKSIESVIEELLHRFNLANESINHSKGKSTEKILAVRKIGLKVSNLFRYENKNFQLKQKTIFDYIN